MSAVFAADFAVAEAFAAADFAVAEVFAAVDFAVAEAFAVAADFAAAAGLDTKSVLAAKAALATDDAERGFVVKKCVPLRQAVRPRRGPFFFSRAGMTDNTRYIRWRYEHFARE